MVSTPNNLAALGKKILLRDTLGKHMTQQEASQQGSGSKPQPARPWQETELPGGRAPRRQRGFHLFLTPVAASPEHARALLALWGQAEDQGWHLEATPSE